jgi:hypothetical protein
LTAKEKLSEEDVQAYKYWLIDRSREDNFESLVEWVELRVQVMEEAKEETKGIERTQKNVRNGRNAFEASIQDPLQGIALSKLVMKITHLGFVKHSAIYQYLREEN